jgi:hypothetical protein
MKLRALPRVLQFLELESLRRVCSPVLWTETDDVFTMQVLQAREMQEAG